MAKIKVLPKLTKSYILQNLRQEKIAYFYTKVPVNKLTLTGNSFTSPLRRDSHPTCNYYYNENGKLRLKDWRGDFDGDIFDIVGHKIKQNSRTPQGFQIILNKIASDFKIHQYGEEEARVNLENYIQILKTNRLIKTFKVVPRKLNRFDERYWSKKYGVSSYLLKKGKVIPVQELYIENSKGFVTRRYRYKISDPAYAYYGGKYQGKVIWKIYFPLRDKGDKFIQNKSFIQGEHLMLPSRVGIITKAYKDVLCMKTFGLQAVALASESKILTKEEYFRIKNRHSILISVMDYDKAGITMALKLRKEYNIIPIMFTRGRYGAYDYGVKDFSDFVNIYGRDKTKTLINKVIFNNRDIIDYIREYEYNSLKWLAA